ncbi:hypothetical protein GCM10010413_10590 [Promicromonospora sukumoe]|uniref:Uncharacterized protein n=1 Tax=Promicromonospora sukumoe TaxID=88382 RepID=A0A7W3J5Q4_9MICO|nr:hypothetical protein [Promicromonospora sukumoe]MBA8806723.1 hypothetical protein [Promicromonospora sukumoe]
MLNVEFARDLVFTAVLFGLVTFMWAGWAQERPPAGVVWRVVLGVLSAGGLALLGLGLPPLIRNWGSPTAMVSGSPALIAYIVVFWLEVAVIAGLAIFYARSGRQHLLPPTVLIVVGTHFAPLALVFQQPVMMLAAVLITAAGVVSLFLPRQVAAPSFWCGILAAPVFLVLGAVSLVAGQGALAG